MKRLFILFIGLAVAMASFDVSAQEMDKKERKEWKKRVKKLEPEEYKGLIEENRSLKSQVSSLRNMTSQIIDREADYNPDGSLK